MTKSSKKIVKKIFQYIWKKYRQNLDEPYTTVQYHISFSKVRFKVEVLLKKLFITLSIVYIFKKQNTNHKRIVTGKFKINKKVNEIIYGY